MKNAMVTYDSSQYAWVVYHGFIHLFTGSADALDQWLSDNADEYTEVSQVN